MIVTTFPATVLLLKNESCKALGNPMLGLITDNK